MTLDKSKILGEFPFSCLNLPDDETIHFEGSNPTFHRRDIQAVLISNKALYLWALGLFAKWHRFPLTEIKRAMSLSKREYEHRVVRQLLGAGLGLFVFVILCWFVFAIWGITELGGYCLIYGGLPVLLFIVFAAWEKIKNPHTTLPCALYIEMVSKTYTWQMTWDDDADEVDYDCWMVQSTLDKLAELGVKTAHRERRLRD